MDFNSIMNSVPSNEQKGDYLQNGVLFCGKCGTPKEFELLGIMRPIVCACVKAAQIERESAIKHRDFMCRVERNTRHGIQDKRYLGWTFANDDMSNPNATAIAKRYVDEWAQNKEINKGLLFLGAVGVGKTYLACAIANALLQKGVTVYVTDLPTLLKRATDFNDNVTNDIERCSLLVIDDVGVERSTEFATEQIYNIINTRYKTGKPLIVTTNLTGQEMAYQKDIDKQRIYDRILEMCCINVVMIGESRRPGIRKNKQKA